MDIIDLKKEKLANILNKKAANLLVIKEYKFNDAEEEKKEFSELKKSYYSAFSNFRFNTLRRMYVDLLEIPEYLLTTDQEELIELLTFKIKETLVDIAVDEFFIIDRFLKDINYQEDDKI